MVIIFVFSTSNYTLWNKKKFKNRVALKPKRPLFSYPVYVEIQNIEKYLKIRNNNRITFILFLHPPFT